MCYDELDPEPALPVDDDGVREPAKIALLVVTALLLAGFAVIIVGAAHPVPRANCADQASVDKATAAQTAASHWLGAGLTIVGCAWFGAVCGAIAAVGWRRYFVLVVVAAMVGGVLLTVIFLGSQGLFAPCSQPFY